MAIAECIYSCILYSCSLHILFYFLVLVLFCYYYKGLWYDLISFSGVVILASPSRVLMEIWSSKGVCQTLVGVRND